MRTRVKWTPRTWLLVVFAMVFAGVMTYFDQRGRAAEPHPSPEPTPEPAYQVEMELVD